MIDQTLQPSLCFHFIISSFRFSWAIIVAKLWETQRKYSETYHTNYQLPVASVLELQDDDQENGWSIAKKPLLCRDPARETYSLRVLLSVHNLSVTCWNKPWAICNLFCWQILSWSKLFANCKKLSSIVRLVCKLFYWARYSCAVYILLTYVTYMQDWQHKNLTKPCNMSDDSPCKNI